MVRIVNCCYPNLRENFMSEPLGDDITNEVAVGTSPVILLASANTNRKIIKIYSIEYSVPAAVVWIRHGTNVSAVNSAFPLLVKRLYENASQAARPLSVVCSSGIALLKFTVVNKL